MNLSGYLKTYLLEEKPGYRLLYSTKKSSIILLKEETYTSIRKGILSPENEAALSRLGMIVHDKEHEEKEVHNLLDDINANNSGLNISVILNLDCNFNCIYCYEGGLKGKFYMTDETADLLLDFIKSRFTDGKNSLNIDFYGGEPLLSLNLIKGISANLKSYTEERGAAYTFTLVTNASLLKRTVVKDLALLGLTGVRITIDGPPNVHNINRPFKSGAGSFDTIIKNIKETYDIVKIGIGGNFQKDNYKLFPELLNILESEELTPDRIDQLKFDPVLNKPGENNAPTDFTDGCMSINEPWLIKSGLFLREEVLKRGYNTPKLRPSPCQVEIRDTYVVNIDGVMYKCPALIGKEDFAIGNLRDGVIDYSKSYNLGIWKNYKCFTCEYLTLCFGGCRYMTYVREGNIDNIDCKRPYFDAVVETLIKQDIKYRPYRKTMDESSTGTH